MLAKVSLFMLVTGKHPNGLLMIMVKKVDTRTKMSFRNVWIDFILVVFLRTKLMKQVDQNGKLIKNLNLCLWQYIND